MKVAHVASLSRRRFSFLLTTSFSLSAIIGFKVPLNASVEASRLRLSMVALWPHGRDGRALLHGSSSARSMAIVTPALSFLILSL
jgi:hypothetical protein